MKSEETFRDIYRSLWNNGRFYSPRGMKVLEIENFFYILPPYVRFANFESRKLSLDYIKREFLWYLRADKYDTRIEKYAKMWTEVKTHEGVINSNYGQYLFGEYGSFRYVTLTLENDKDSRRACMTILKSDHLYLNNPDIPCTYALSFRIRDNKLNMTVRMRSQDAILGMGSDAPAFSFIHEMVYEVLLKTYPDLQPGNYYHSADSFHVYERHLGILEKICNEDKYKEIKCPKILDYREVEFLLANHFEAIPPEFKFAQWLNTFQNV
jgi:thymidylate synthase